MCGLASASPIATGKHIGDCDLVPSTVSRRPASCTPALEAGDARSTARIKRVAGSTRVPFVLLFVHKKCPRNHRDTGHSNTYPTPTPTSISAALKKHKKKTRLGAAHAIDQKSRRGANEEKFHQTKMFKDPLIIVRGKELVAPDPTAREHHPGSSWSGPAPADQDRTAGAPQLCSTQQ